MEATVKLLCSYGGREKVMRTAAFAAMLVAGSSRGETARKAGIVSQQVNAARVVLRLFGDLPMLAHTLSYGLGSKERDGFTRALSVVSNLASQLFFPVEHLAWAGDHKLVDLKTGPLYTTGLALWATSLAASILRNIRAVILHSRSRTKLQKHRNLESPDKSDAADQSFKQAMAELRQKQTNELVDMIKNSSDFLLAITFLPPGFLWSGKLSTAQSGALGTLSSLIGLCQILAK